MTTKELAHNIINWGAKNSTLVIGPDKQTHLSVDFGEMIKLMVDMKAITDKEIVELSIRDAMGVEIIPKGKI